jgi:hypothetical protein
MELDFAAALIGWLSVIGAVLSLWATKRAARPSPTKLEDRLADLGDTMRSAALLLEEVQAEIQTRIALAEKAKLDADEADQVAQLNEAQRVAVARLVRAELASEVSHGTKRSFWLGFATNFFFFIAGVALTLWLGS